jgi:AcrR family transcriptional regulator
MPRMQKAGKRTARVAPRAQQRRTATLAKSAPTTARGAGTPARGRRVEPQARRQAILDAALAIFAERGFDAARLDDVAARAGVAKGTLYLYFHDKEALFEELIRSAVKPVFEGISQAARADDVPASEIFAAFFTLFEKEVLDTHRKLLLRLVISEGPRFPAIAEFYHREVVSRGLRMLREVAARGVRDGEFSSDAVARFPQLVVAPLLMAVIWDGLFAKLDPLDARGLLRAHLELLAGKPARTAP